MKTLFKNFPLFLLIFSLSIQAQNINKAKLDSLFQILESKDKFEFTQAGIVLEFNPATSEMTLNQGGRKFILKK